ncbi:MAG: molecular chaperone DnaJ, partial [Gammaproteobacteria bacterium]|nr:molecular chaperone DnaJ [Gammaproteobacteria bacterium]
GETESESKFKEAKEAYEVLRDSDKRAAYDRFGHDGLRGAGMGGPGGFSAEGFSAEGFSDIFGDVFGDIFGGGGRRGGRQVFRGADLGYELRLDLERAVRGDTVTIDVPSQVTCEVCDGSGAKKGTTPVQCSTCGGAGQVRMQQGFFSIQQTCPACKGAGTMISDPCETCHGRGRVRKTRTLSVKVPAGVDDGDRIRLSGEGEAGRNGGPPGDLYVEIRLEPHKIFVRDGADLSCEVPISYATAALGGDVELPTLDGNVSLKVPAGTQSGNVFRLRGKGVTMVRDPRKGDLFAKVAVETPVNLTNEQKELLSKFDTKVQKGGDKHSPRADTWFDTVKRFFERIGH